jgi:hypothetical protein
MRKRASGFDTKAGCRRPRSHASAATGQVTDSGRPIGHGFWKVKTACVASLSGACDPGSPTEGFSKLGLILPGVIAAPVHAALTIDHQTAIDRQTRIES